METLKSDTKYAASISYGKDSLAMLHVVTDVLHWPLDRIVTADVWATDTITADLPPMAEFKLKADEAIKERWGIDVEHFCALNPDGTKKTFDSHFHRRKGDKSKYAGDLIGWPLGFGQSWCNGELKRAAMKMMQKSIDRTVSYVGIAADEGDRAERHKGKVERGLELLPLVEAGWTEQMCREWCEENGLLSPVYKTRGRDGCWFCINQRNEYLRELRRDYPELYGLMLKWDDEVIKDDPKRQKKFRCDHTLHDIERRFQIEDAGYFMEGEKFMWSNLEAVQMNIFQFLGGENGRE